MTRITHSVIDYQSMLHFCLSVFPSFVLSPLQYQVPDCMAPLRPELSCQS